MTLLLMTLLAGSAQADTLILTEDPSGAGEYATLGAALGAAAPGDEIVVEPGEYPVNEAYRITFDVTIRAAHPPSVIDDDDIVDDSILYVSIFSPVRGADQVFDIQPGATLTMENMVLKGPEMYCDDDVDNDGNGLVDDDDFACADEDDSATFLDFVLFRNPMRGFWVRPNAGLILEGTQVQGMTPLSLGTLVGAPTKEDLDPIDFGGGVAVVDNAATLQVRNSYIGFNQTIAYFGGSLFQQGGKGGAFHIDGTIAEFEDVVFDRNLAQSGGAIFATNASDITILDSQFLRNQSFFGGALYLESSQLRSERNEFSGNAANILAPATEDGHQDISGGAVLLENCIADFFNNLFVDNFAEETGAVLWVRGEAPGLSPTPIRFVNNTVVLNSTGFRHGGILRFDGVEFEFRNNIASANDGGLITSQDWGRPYGPDISFNLFDEEEVGSLLVGELSLHEVRFDQNLFAPPLFQDAPSTTGADDFVDPDIYSFWPEATSPTIDAGDPNYTPDIRGTIVPWEDRGGSIADLGNYGGPFADVEDLDGDGYESHIDCNDDPDYVGPGGVRADDIYPFQLEDCNDIDDDCNGIVDDREITYYADVDLDGYGDDATVDELCPEIAPTPLPTGIWVTVPGDCDDDDPRVNPGNPEFCDDLDNDCDGAVDEDIPVRDQYFDADGDGFGDDGRADFVLRLSCPPTADYTPLAGDCNDNNPDIHPLVTRAAREHQPLALKPLEDNEASRDPAYVADGVDQDCDGGDLCYTDLDGDGFGASAPGAGRPPTYTPDNDLVCSNLSAFTSANSLDCDDRSIDTRPTARELPGDGVDSNCDGAESCYEDLDGDGFGNTDQIVIDDDLDCNNDTIRSSSLPGDCNDAAQGGDAANPARVEECDGIDNDCDGDIDEVSSPESEEFFLDRDGDGFGDVTQRIKACGQPIGYARQPGDCNDNEPRAYPGAPEQCDGIDNDCEAGIDEKDAVDVRTWYQDLDGDGLGNPDVLEESCERPEEGGPWVLAGTAFDCNDNEETVGPCATCLNTTAPVSHSPFLPLVGALLSFGMVRRRREEGEGA